MIQHINGMAKWWWWWDVKKVDGEMWASSPHLCQSEKVNQNVRTESSSRKKKTRENYQLHLNGRCECVCCMVVFVIINHWLLHQVVKRLNKTKAICFPLHLFLGPLCCVCRWFFSTATKIYRLFFFFTVCRLATDCVYKASKTFPSTTSSLSSEIYSQCNPNHMWIIF